MVIWRLGCGGLGCDRIRPTLSASLLLGCLYCHRIMNDTQDEIFQAFIVAIFQQTEPLPADVQSEFNQYVWQVEADNRSLTAGLRLLENAIQTIEGIIEIERAKSDRTLNVTIGAVGAGMATSGVVASTYASQINSPASRDNPMDVNVVFGLSMGCGILVGAIVLIAIRKKWR